MKQHHGGSRGEPSLAPAPDFRYVGLAPGGGVGLCLAGGVAVAGASAAAGLYAAFGLRPALAFAVLASAGAAASIRAVFSRRSRRSSSSRVAMAIVPWGILLEEEEQPRVLRWAAVRSVRVEMTYARDQASDSTRFSVVTVDTDHERFVARAAGAVPLDRLLVHLEAYARESAHAISLDLDGARAGDGPIEPDCEPLLHAARVYVGSAPGSIRLGLEGGGYRGSGVHAASPVALAELRRVLRDRTERPVDPRPFAAVVAAELGARDLTEEVIALVQSPHPVVAAVAKAAACRLGVATARAGTLDEVAPFLLDEDRRALEAWASS